MDTTPHMSLAQDEILKICTNIIGARDEYTQGHCHHVYVVTQAMIQRGDFPLDTDKLARAALLHDLGKILIPDTILNKDGPLDEPQWQQMRRHPQYGVQLLKGTLFEDLHPWILYHHERMDGKGYHGLEAADIPLASKIIAVADTFSALRTYRIYRPAKTIRQTVAILQEVAGTQLDARVLSVLLSYGERYLEALECNCDICRRRREAQTQAAPVAGVL